MGELQVDQHRIEMSLLPVRSITSVHQNSSHDKTIRIKSIGLAGFIMYHFGGKYNRLLHPCSGGKEIAAQVRYSVPDWGLKN
jgi:hypothetical protein